MNAGFGAEDLPLTGHGLHVLTILPEPSVHIRQPPIVRFQFSVQARFLRHVRADNLIDLLSVELKLRPFKAPCLTVFKRHNRLRLQPVPESVGIQQRFAHHPVTQLFHFQIFQ